jgi:PadR family transcriptional regulator, regulatory protein PadR
VSRSRRPSSQTVRVLVALAADPAVWRYGYELGADVGLRSGSLYPILVRLADRGLLEATWETDSRGGRPPRHLYRLTPEGLKYSASQIGSPAVAVSGRRLSLGGAS